MFNSESKVLSAIGRGAFFGGAVWSAYAVVEFLSSSVVFRLTRPYAGFTPWHWRLTFLLLIGYLICGAAVGAAAGLGIALWKRRARSEDCANATVESAA